MEVMRIALLAYGSRGDIQPMVAVADELRQRGHSVVMTANTNLAPWAARAGVEVVPCPPDIEAFLHSDEARGFLADGRTTTFTRALAEVERAANAGIVAALTRASAGADLILSTILTAMRAVYIAEKTRARHRLLMTMPVQPTRAWPTIFTPLRDLGLGVANRWSHHLFLELFWHRMRAPLRETAALLGVRTPARRPRVEHIPSAHVYSPLLAPRPADWNPAHVVTGFCAMSPALRARLGEGALPAELAAWLDAGPPPVFFGFGSIPVRDPAAMLATVAALARRRRIRALVGAGWTRYATTALPDDVFVAPAFDHDRVLPRCRAAVHHGGAGTTAAALRAGLPTLVTSVFTDQPFWGWRVQQLGVGTTLPFQRINAERLDQALAVLLDPVTTARARRLGERLRAEDGTAATADQIERWAGLERCPAA